MSRSGFSEDASALLYLVPFVASGVYAIVLWVQAGISAYLPTNVYLTVTRDPFLFAIGTISVILGVTIEVRGVEPAGRQAKLNSLSNTLQSVAAASLVLVLFSAIYANGFDLSGAATDFIVGRYGLVFPVMLVLFSYLVTAQFKLESLRNPKVLAIVVLLLVPVSIYEIGKRETALGLGISLALLVVGLALLLMRGNGTKAEKQ
jgi:hypothetical protein